MGPVPSCVLPAMFRQRVPHTTLREGPCRKRLPDTARYCRRLIRNSLGSPRQRQPRVGIREKSLLALLGVLSRAASRFESREPPLGPVPEVFQEHAGPLLVRSCSS